MAELRTGRHGREDVRPPLAGMKRASEGVLPTGEASGLGRPELDALRAAFVMSFRIRGLPPSLQLLEQLRAIVDMNRFAPQTREPAEVAPRIVNVVLGSTSSGAGVTTSMYIAPAGVKAKILACGVSMLNSSIDATIYRQQLVVLLGAAHTSAVAEEMVLNSVNPSSGQPHQMRTLGERVVGLVLFPADELQYVNSRLAAATDITHSLFLQVLEIPLAEEFL